MWDAPISYEVVSEYANGTTISMSNRHKMGENQWIGEDGWIWVTADSSKLRTYGLAARKNDREPIKGYVSPGTSQKLRRWRQDAHRMHLPRRDRASLRYPGHIGYVSQKLEARNQVGPRKRDGGRRRRSRKAAQSAALSRRLEAGLG
ncbi:MAG: hypothetical protein R3F11_09235 [Verrucomicrobiales bacterium]